MTNSMTPRVRSFATAILTAAVLLAGCASPSPDPTLTSSISSGSKKKQIDSRGTGYFIDFRSRFALSYGHTFVVYGKLGPNGRIASSKVAGLHPAGDDPTPWTLGHFFPVPSETGASDGDTEDQYVTASYRIYLTPEQFENVSGFIRKLQASSPVWHAVFYNCNAFVADIARYMGLKSPGTLALPADFINGIRTMNGDVSRITLPTAAMADGAAMTAQ